MPLNMNTIHDKLINDATASQSDVIYGKIFYNNDGKQKGSLQLKEFDIRSEKTDMFPVTSDVYKCGKFIYDDQLYALSTTTFNDGTTKLFIYNIKRKTWSYETISGLQNKMMYACVTLSGNMLSAYYQSANVTDPYAICIYNLKNKSSYTISVDWLKCFNVINDTIYYNNGYPTFSSTTIYKINEKNESNTSVTNLPFAYCNAIVGNGNTLYFCGCYDKSTKSSNNICMYRNKTLTQLANIPTSVEITQSHTFVYGNKIIFLDENSSSSADTNSYMYDTVDNSWTQLITVNTVGSGRSPRMHCVFSYENRWYTTCSTVASDYYTAEIFTTYKI